jgi:hypothetical protein
MLSFIFKDLEYFFQQMVTYKGHFFENENRLLEKKAIKNLLRKHKKMNDFMLPILKEHINTLLLTVYLESILTKQDNFSVYFRDNQAKKYTLLLTKIEKELDIRFFSISKEKINDESLSKIIINMKKISHLELFKKIDLTKINLSQLNYITEDNAIILVEHLVE